MPLDRDDADERIARLEKLMHEARTKPAAAGDAEPAPTKGQGSSAPVKVVEARPAAKKRRP